MPNRLDGKAWGGEFGFQVKDGKQEQAFISGAALASLIGSLADTHTKDLTINGFSNSNGSSPAPSVSHKNGINGELRYLRKDKTGGSVILVDAKVDITRQRGLINSLSKFGWKDMLSEKFSVPGSAKPVLFKNTSSASARGVKTDHTTHLHLQGYNPNLTILTSVSR